MQLARPLTAPRRRSRSRAGRLPLTTVAAVTPARERNQRANVSQDAALYTCGCGYVFTAEVTTSVGCPHCGTSQAW
jgi:hypothetical protein